MVWFYLHSEGALIEKPDRVVAMGGGPLVYFNSPFVRSYWQESDFLRPVPTSPRQRGGR